MEMTVSEIRRMYRLSKNKKNELSILAELNDCSVEKIAELVVDIPTENDIAQKRVRGMADGKPYVHHRDLASDRIRFYKKFSKNLSTAMRRKGMDLTTLARESNSSKSAISSYVHAERLPDIFSLSKISKVLNVSADELLGTGVNKDGE